MAISQGVGAEIRLADLTPFAWKRVLILAPYSRGAMISDSLHVNRLTARRLADGIEVREDINLLVFELPNGRLESMEVGRGVADFGPELTRRVYLPQQAVFRVRTPPEKSHGNVGPQ